MKLPFWGRKTPDPAPSPDTASEAPLRAAHITLGALQRLDGYNTFLGLFGPQSFGPQSGAVVRRLPDGSEEAELPADGLRITLHDRMFKLEAIGINPTVMAALVAGTAFRHAVQAEPDWSAVSQDGASEVLEGSVPLGPVSLLATIRAGEQAVAGRRGHGSSLWIGLGAHRDTTPARDDLSRAAAAGIAQGEGQRLGNAKVLLAGMLLQLRLDDARPLTDLMAQQPLDPPLPAQGRNSMGQTVFADPRRGLWCGVTADRVEISAPASGTAPAIAALSGTFQFFAGEVSPPTATGDVTAFVLTSGGGRVFDLTVKPEATPFKDPGGRVVPGVTIALSRRPA